MLALLRFALNSSIFVDHNEFLDELTLGASVKDDKTDNKRTEKQWTKCQRFAKLKELQADTQADPNCSTFNFAQPHPKPTHHPISGQVTI